jgi:hypothetical protein
VSGGVAHFLIGTKPSWEVLMEVAKIERHVDLSFISARVAASEAATAWLESLRRLEISVSSINDDEYQASDELERWQKELTKPVPSWRVGDFPPLGDSAVLVASGTCQRV